MTGTAGRVLRMVGYQRTVSNLEHSVRFYCEALGFSPDDGAPPEAGQGPQADVRVACLRLGMERIALACPRNTTDSSRLFFGASVTCQSFQHFAIVTPHMAAAMERLQGLLPQPISSAGAVQLPPAAGGVTAYKFRDPDGHALELIQFPTGAGDSRWQHPQRDALTLGVDHSAIGTSDVTHSLAFYTQGLGFVESSRQTNHGREQALLDGLDESVVDVVGLHPAQVGTPHVELLAYRTPPPQAATRRGALQDDPGDRMIFIVDDLAALRQKLDAMFAHRSDEWQALEDDALLLRDGDGHLSLLQQASSL